MFLQKSLRSGGVPKFHHHHGQNIVFDENNVTATRFSSFSNGITFSALPLAPGEIFLIEIEDTEPGWSGHMRLGLTQMDPNAEFPLPLYALPDLASMGPSWLFAITKKHNNAYVQQDTEDLFDFELPPPLPPLPPPPQNRERNRGEGDEEFQGGLSWGESVIESEPNFSALSLSPPGLESNFEEMENDANHKKRNLMGERVVVREGSVTRTPCGYIQTKSLTKCSDKLKLLNTDIGSRIGVLFNPTGYNRANMHFIINGEDQGASISSIPYLDSPIYAVVDVYGSTKRVRTVQIYGGMQVDSLQSMCRDTILQSIKLSGIGNLPLPKLLKRYLLHQDIGISKELLSTI